MWITSSKVLPIIMLVVIPFSVIVSSLSLTFYVRLISNEFEKGFPFTFSYLYLISLGSIVYVFYASKFDVIKRRGFSNLLVEQVYIKRILCFEITILVVVIFLIFFAFLSKIPSPLQQGDVVERGSLAESIYNIYQLIGAPFAGHFVWVTFPSSDDIPILDVGYSSPVIFGYYILQALMINLGFSVTAGIIWMIIFTARKELGYHISKELFQATTQEEEGSKKAEYLIKATKIYDKYLRRTLNLEINNAKRIYSKILSDPNLNENKSIQQISKSFDSKNKLAPIKSLSEIAYVEGDKDTFLVDESIGKRIKDMAIFFATIIPVAVAVIQLLLQRQ